MGVVRKHIFSLFKNGTSPVFPPHLEGEIIFSTHDDGKCVGSRKTLKKKFEFVVSEKIFGGEAAEEGGRNTRALFSIPRPQKDLLLFPPDFSLEMSVCAYALSRIYALLLGKIFFQKKFLLPPRRYMGNCGIVKGLLSNRMAGNQRQQWSSKRNSSLCDFVNATVREKRNFLPSSQKARRLSSQMSE